jgi:hypothetical protein
MVLQATVSVLKTQQVDVFLIVHSTAQVEIVCLATRVNLIGMVTMNGQVSMHLVLW